MWQTGRSLASAAVVPTSQSGAPAVADFGDLDQSPAGSPQLLSSAGAADWAPQQQPPLHLRHDQAPTTHSRPFNSGRIMLQQDTAAPSPPAGPGSYNTQPPLHLWQDYAPTRHSRPFTSSETRLQQHTAAPPPLAGLCSNKTQPPLHLQRDQAPTTHSRPSTSGRIMLQQDTAAPSPPAGPGICNTQPPLVTCCPWSRPRCPPEDVAAPVHVLLFELGADQVHKG